MHRIHEHFSRSIVKAITFRLLILASDAIIIMFITHRLDTTIAVIVCSNLASTGFYIIHERLWNRFDWGIAIRNH